MGEPRSVEGLLRALPWRPIRGCPGRYSLPAGDQPFETIAGRAPLVFRVAGLRDEVLAARLAGGGGVLSYRRTDGTVLHTLGTPEGFARKLSQLGITLPE